MDEPPNADLSDNFYAALNPIYTTNLNEDYNFVGEVRAILQEYEYIDGDHRYNEIFKKFCVLNRIL